MPFLVGFTLVTSLCFAGLFFGSQARLFSFWEWMSVLLFLLNGLGFVLGLQKRKRFIQDIGAQPLRNIFIGSTSAVFLLIVFLIGGGILRLIWPESGEQIEGVYAYKQGFSRYYLGLLLGLIIGPGEEVLWRWFLQEEWMKKLGPWSGWVLVTGVYTLVHLPTRNPVLVLAALSCGLFWGWLFLQFRSLLANIISHSLWDILIFIIFPFK